MANLLTLTLDQQRKMVRGGAQALLFGLCVATGSIPGQQAVACAFDLTKPERTIIDWIVSSETLVLARAARDNPFAFHIETVLVGDDITAPIDQLVDTATRRKLSANPEHAVLFARTAGDAWRRVAYADGGLRPILDTALAHRASWATGMPQSRVAFIDALQDSPDPRHRPIVIGELDKIPYAQLRQFDLRVPADELAEGLWTQGGYPYQAVHALLLGLSGTDHARAVVKDVLDRAGAGGSFQNLGAFSAAFIELEGAAGVAALSGAFLGDVSLPADVLEQVVTALAVHYGLADQPVQAEIDQALARLVQSRPAAGAIVARQFSLRNDWSQSDTLKPLIEGRRLTTMSDLRAVTIYLARAQSAAIGQQNDG